MEDGNSRNGYHKVKCQVPETEELQGREKEVKINQQYTNRANTAQNTHMKRAQMLLIKA